MLITHTLLRAVNLTPKSASRIAAMASSIIFKNRRIKSQQTQVLQLSPSQNQPRVTTTSLPPQTPYPTGALGYTTPLLTRKS